MPNKKLSPAFTIVELLIVIVIIGILAAITIVSYTGITSKANIASIQSDLANAAKRLNLYYVDHGQFPQGLDNTTHCPTTPADNNYCIKVGANTDLVYQPNGTYQDFTLTATKNTVSYKVTKDTAPVYVASGAQSFVKTWGGSGGSDIGYGIVQSVDGGYAITGYTDSYGAGATDVLFVKYDINGNLVWNKTWGGTGSDIGEGIIQTNDGGYILTGYTSSYGVSGSNDAIIVKYDASGALLWNKTWGGTGADIGQAISQSADGSFVVSGYTTSYGAGGVDTFLVKYDSSGNFVWSKTWGGTNNDYGQSLTQSNDGGYVITGYTDSYGVGTDIFLAKYDASGSLIWNKTWGGSGSDTVYSIVQSNDGGYALTGYTNSFGAGGEDVFLIKYDTNGNIMWNKTWGGSGAEYSRSLAQTIDGGYALAGYTTSYGAGGTDTVLIKYDTNGNLIWSKTWGGSGGDVVVGYQKLVQTSDGGYAIAGYTGSYGSGGNDMLLIKYSNMGLINNCLSPMCQSPSATVTSPTASVSSPTASVTAPPATVTSPSATVTSPSATVTTVVAP